MASELNMYESQVSEYKYEIERLARELQEVKKKYFMQKKKEQSTKWAWFCFLGPTIFKLAKWTSFDIHTSIVRTHKMCLFKFKYYFLVLVVIC